MPTIKSLQGINGVVNLNNAIVGGTGGAGLTAQALPQISISGLGTGPYASMFSNNEAEYGPHVKKYEIYEIDEDLLALSVALKRLSQNSESNGIHTLLDKRLFSNVTASDRDTAKEIRDFYSKKIMLWKLKGNNMSQFRNRLNSFIHSDGTKFRHEILGLAYHLPNFYLYDSELDKVRVELKNANLAKRGSVSNDTKSYRPICCIESIRKSSKQDHYWFANTEDNTGLLITIDKVNVLNSVWKHLFKTKKLLHIKGKFYVTGRDDFEYYCVKDWEITNI